MTTTTTDKRSANDSARATAMRTYRHLLDRYDAPKDGDADLLFETIGTLDLTFPECERDAEVRWQALVNKRIAAELPRLQQELNEVELKVEAGEARSIYFVHSVDAHARARRAALEFARAKREHRELLDDLEIK